MCKKLKWTLLVLVFIVGGRLTAVGNNAWSAKDTLIPLMEVMKLEDKYASMYNTGFSFYYHLTDILWSPPYYINDTTQGFIRFEKDKYWYQIGNMHQMQDQNYRVTVYTEDSIMYVEPLQPLRKAVLQLDVFESTLGVDSVKMTDSLNYRKLSFTFKPQSPYLYYNIIYDTSTYLYNRINYKINKTWVSDSESSVLDMYTLVDIWFNSAMLIEPYVPFSMDMFFTRKNGVFIPAAAYTNFKIVDATKQ